MTPSGSRHPAFDRPLPSLPFATVNRCGISGHDPELQRHHLLPCQALTCRSISRMLAALGEVNVGFHDFRRNGILLPARARAALRLGLPLHRGPHRDYNAMVLERLGRIESTWARGCLRDEHGARAEASFQIAMLQRALRRRILDGTRRLRFSRHDPLAAQQNFDHLDALTEELWSLTG